MQARRAIQCALFGALLPLLAGCAAPDGEYPSLAIRDAERITGTIEPEPYVPPPPAPAVLSRTEDLVDAARAAHGRFLAAVPEARRRANAAQGAGIGSEAWSVAQVAVAGLETHRGEVMISLADLDRLYVAASSEGEAIAPIADDRAAVATLAEEEDAVIAELLAAIGR
ncbi:hypothetical protein [Aurantiacibacter aquimixticola]|uniref:Uncharacterized protein n=1 Tax=Aurantiacibacter aquimixticola TaxID=1958945 RepID=A0A419RWC3_9SPHN|nr:hypothetical protein [Aurantiacibacter aquimixticola]RJY10092.1 hypothetical protein D6201_00370 [Aurantiacibacter aquimixticola]